MFPSAKGLSFFMYLLFMQESIVFSFIPFLYIFFCKHHVVWKDLGTYIQLDMSDHELLLLTLPLR